MKVPSFAELLNSFPRSNDPLGFAGTWREEAVRVHLLPIFSDWESYYALTEDAEPVYVNDSWSSPQRFNNRRWQHIVLAQAALRYPELASLRPIRNPDDPPCPSCGGTGRVRVGETTLESMICECGGLGWIPKGSALEPPL